jgi:sugar phosphate isomerase/epimerase
LQVAFTTYSTPAWSPETIAEQAATLGFDAVELRMYDGHAVPSDLTSADCARLRQVFAARGLPLCALGTSCHFSGEEDQRQAQVAEARRYLAIASELHAPLMRVFGGAYGAGVSPEEACRRVAAALAELAEPARAAGVTLALETHDAFAAGAMVGAVLAEVRHPCVGACWDWLHPFRVGETVAATHDHLRGRVVHTHTKDAARVGGGWEARFFGQGELPLADLLAALVADGYDGPLSLEWEPRGGDPHPERALAHYLPAMRALLARQGR